MTVRLMKPMRFQLTASRRGWPSLKHKCRKSMSISTHSLTKRLTMHSKLTRLNQFYFNSQPHEEADFYWLWKRYHPDISTHSLTKRLTTTMPTKTNYHIGISTHSLTKRLTNIKDNFFHLFGISTHSLTKRLTSAPSFLVSFFKYFNSQPHEEADCSSRNFTVRQ